MNRDKPSFPRSFRQPLLALIIGSLLYQNSALANPVGGKVVAGSVNIVKKAPGQLEIIQNSHKAVIDWRGFSIARGEHTRFRQPSAAAIALNRVRGGQASLIDGALSANGRVWLINPNGVLFGKGAQINVGSLMATTSDINNEDFMAGRFAFDKPTDNLQAAIVNQGHIEVSDGGSIVLAAPRVSNEGSIMARLGHVVLASGDTFTMDFHGDGLLQFDIGDPVQQSIREDKTAALVANSGRITVDGGIVEMTAKTRNTMIERVINMEGVVQARAVDVKGGTIILSGGETGIVAVSGTLDVSGKELGQVGGVAKVLGEKVGLFDGAEIDASGDAGGGEVLVGGNLHGEGPEQNARETLVADDVAIYADAFNEGNGGLVAVWADESADINGTLTARGGNVSGDGGFIETSGKQFLSLSTSPDASASNGKGGTWLIDPTDITIVDSLGDGINTSFVGAEIINNTLDSGTNVILDTSTATNTTSNEFPDGNITQESGASINKTAGGDATLTLQAENTIFINDNISSTANQLNVVLNSDRDGNGAGAIVINPGANISSNGGDIVMGGGSNPLEDFAFGTTINPDGGIKIEGDDSTFVEINAEGGDIIINGKGVASNDNNQFGGSGVSVDKSVLKTSDGGRIRIQGDGGNGIFLEAIDIESSEIVTEDGNIDLLGVGNSDIFSNSIFIDSSKVQSSGSGSITISSTDSDGELENISIFSGDIGTNSGNIDITSTKVELDGDTNVRSKEGDIRLDGSGEGIDVTDTILETSGNGNITLRGVSENADQAGVNLSSFEGEGFSPGPIITTGTGNGTILIQADRLTMDDVREISGSGTLKMESIDLGQDIVIFENSPASGASDSVGYEIDNSSIKDGFSEIIIGHENGAGTVTVEDDGVVFKDNITLRAPNSEGSIIIDGPIQTNGNDLTLQAGNDIDINATADIITSGGNISLFADFDNVDGGSVGIGNNPDRTEISTSGGNFTAFGRSNLSSFIGVIISNTDLDAGGGNIAITGQGQFNEINRGIVFSGNPVVKTTGTGNITLDGSTIDGVIANHGILIEAAGGLIKTQNGDIGITGIADGTGSGNIGIEFAGNGIVETTGGKVEISGQGGNGTAGNSGISFLNTSKISSVDGNINLNGTSNGENGSGNIGIILAQGSSIQSTGNGSIGMDGVGGNGRLVNHGVFVLDSNTLVQTADGNISITGTGGDESTGSTSDPVNNDGISIINGARVESTGLGNINFVGSAGQGELDNQGIAIGTSDTNLNSIVKTNIGNIDLVGTGSDSSASPSDFGNHGVFVFDNGAVETDSGSITIEGSSGQNGKGIFAANVFTQQLQPIRIAATSANSTITLRTDQFELRSPTEISGSGILQLEPLDPNQDITVEISDTIQDGFSEIFIGHENGSGTVIVSSDSVSFNDKTTLRSPNSGGQVVIDGEVQTNGNDLALVAGNTVDINKDITTSGGNLDINSGGEVNSSGVIDTGGAITGDPAGAVSINATANITTADIKTNSSFGSPNTITLISTDGNIDTTAGALSSSSDGNGDDITLITQNGAISTLGIDAGSGEIELSASETTEATNADLTLGGDVTAQSVMLKTGDAINQSGGSIQSTQLAIEAESQSTLGSADIVVLAAHITGAGNGFVFSDPNSFTLGTVGDISGITTTNGSVDLQAVDNITFNGGVLTNGGDFKLTGNTLLASDTTINTNGGSIDFNGPVNGHSELTLSAGSTGNIRFFDEVGTKIALGPVSINNANDVTINYRFVAGGTKVIHNGDFITTFPDGFLELESLFVNPEAKSAHLSGTVAGKADKETALAVKGPVDDPNFTINGCVIGISCIIPEATENIRELPLEAEPRPTSGLPNKDAAVAEGLQDVLVEMLQLQRRPSNNPTAYQYSNFGNTEMWDNVPGAYSIASFAAFSPVAAEKDEDDTETNEVEQP